MDAKRNIFSALGCGIIFLLFNLICFISRTNYTTNFFISLAFGNLSFLVFGAILAISSKKKHIHLTYTYHRLTVIYVMVAVILNLLFIWFGLENARVNIAFNAIAAGILIAVIFWAMAADADTEKKTEERMEKINYHMNLCDLVRPLRDSGKSLKVNKKIEALYDAVANSQINADNSLVYQRDQQVAEAVRFVQGMLAGNPEDEIVMAEINKIIAMVEERNEFVKNTKARGV